MIELVVAMVVAVFLLAGLFNVLQGNMDTSTEQTALAQLQDNERFAMQIYTNMIESAGYFPTLSPTGVQNVLEQSLLQDGTTNGTFQTAGQAITGGGNGSGGDMLMSRFLTNPNDGISSCLGRTTAPGDSPTVYKNELKVDTPTNSLTCSDGNGVNAVVRSSAESRASPSCGASTPCRCRQLQLSGEYLSADLGLPESDATAADECLHRPGHPYLHQPAVPAHTGRPRHSGSTSDSPVHESDRHHGQGRPMSKIVMPTRSSQRGMTLIAAMLLLLVITILGVGMFHSFGIQERIAGNTREKHRALHSAETTEVHVETA